MANVRDFYVDEPFSMRLRTASAASLVVSRALVAKLDLDRDHIRERYDAEKQLNADPYPGAGLRRLPYSLP